MALRDHALSETNPFRAKESAKPAPAPAAQPDYSEDDDKVITADQIRAGRALLDWTRQELAAVCDVGEATIARIETGTIDPKASSLRTIAEALAARGVELIPAMDGKGDGVRFTLPRGSRLPVVKPDVPKRGAKPAATKAAKPRRAKQDVKL